MRATTASPVQRAPTPLPALRARAARELSGTGRQTDRDACPWSMNVLPTLGCLINRGRHSGSRSRNDSLSIPNPDTEHEIFKLNPESRARILNYQNSIPMSNPKFFKLHPESRSGISKSVISIPNREICYFNPDPEFWDGFGICSGSSGCQSRIPTSANHMIIVYRNFFPFLIRHPINSA